MNLNLRASSFPTYITFLIVTSYMDVLASCHKGSVFSYPHLSPRHVSKVALEHQQWYPLKIGPSLRSVPQNRALHFTTTAGTHISLPFFQRTAAAVKQRTDHDKSFRLSSCVDCLGRHSPGCLLWSCCVLCFVCSGVPGTGLSWHSSKRDCFLTTQLVS